MAAAEVGLAVGTAGLEPETAAPGIGEAGGTEGSLVPLAVDLSWTDHYGTRSWLVDGSGHASGCCLADGRRTHMVAYRCHYGDVDTGFAPDRDIFVGFCGS